MVSRGVTREGELEVRKTTLEAQHSMSNIFRCHGQDTHLILLQFDLSLERLSVQKKDLIDAHTM